LEKARAPPKIRKQNSRYAELIDGAKCSGIDFDFEIDLSGVTLRDSDFEDAVLTKATLTNSDMSRSRLDGSHLTGVNIDDAVLIRANLRNADLSFSKLRRVDLRGANLTNTNFMDSNLNHTKFSDDMATAELDNTNFKLANLSNTELFSADLRNVELRFANFSGANLAHANLNGADFAGLSGRSEPEFTGANLQRADLTDANLQRADFSQADLSEAMLVHADLANADFTDTDLSEANLSSADCEDAVFKDTKLIRTSMADTDLFSANLSGAFLSGAKIKAAHINDQTQFVEEGPVGDLSVSEYCRYDPDKGPANSEESLGIESESLNDSKESIDIVRLRKARSVYGQLEELFRSNTFSTAQSTTFIRRQEMRRKMLKKQGRLIPWGFAELQRAIFVYGESFRRIAGVSGLIVIGFWFLYMTADIFETTDGMRVSITSAKNTPLIIWDSLHHSILLFFTGTSDILTPTGFGGQILMMLQIISGPVLLALLVFVLGRRAAR